jgi:hypothetical protein
MELAGGEGSASRNGRSLPREDPVPIVQEAGWAPGPVWTGAENLAPTGIRSPNRPASRYTDYATRPTNGNRWVVDESRNVPQNFIFKA